MTSHQPRHSCSCCEEECWPMWATLHNKPYCMNCYGIGCDTKPAECRRPLIDRIAEKVAEAITRDVKYEASCNKHDATILDPAAGADQVNEPATPYGGQAPFLTLALKNEITGDVWTHPIGRQDASALSEWWADQSEYQRQDLPYEVEETVSRIVAAYADAENEDGPRPLRLATPDEIRAYLMKQSGIVSVDVDGPIVRCSRVSDSGRDLITWTHSRLERWNVTIEGGHTWLRGPNGLGWIITNETTIAK